MWDERKIEGVRRKENRMWKKEVKYKVKEERTIEGGERRKENRRYKKKENRRRWRMKGK